MRSREPMGEQLIARVLAEYGYRTLVASSAEEAIRVLDNPELAIDVLLTDVVMPGLPGNELVTHALEVRPGLHALLMSGYSPQMVRAIRSLLDRAPATDALQRTRA